MYYKVSASVKYISKERRKRKKEWRFGV